MSLSQTGPSRLVFNHDGAIDEFVALALLSTLPEIELAAVVVTAADCIAGPAMIATRKLFKFLGISEASVPLGLSASRGWNPFPWEYRTDCLKVNDIPTLQRIQVDQEVRIGDGDTILATLLDASPPRSLSLVVNCPLTTLASVIDKRPQRMMAIDRLFWMGGAIDVPGNISSSIVPLVDGSAEWNAFWDPYAVSYIFRNACFPITLLPLDITNQGKITPGFITSLAEAARTHPLAKFASESYALVANEPFYEMWNVITACAISSFAPSLFAPPTTMRLDIADDGPRQGAIARSEHGAEVEVITKFIDPDSNNRFYDFVLTQLSRES